MPRTTSEGPIFETETSADPTAKLAALVAVPPGVVTLIGPVVDPEGTVVEMEVSELTVKVAATVLKLTAVAPVKFVPAISTLAPIRPLVGEKLVIVGGGITTKLDSVEKTDPAKAVSIAWTLQW